MAHGNAPGWTRPWERPQPEQGAIRLPSLQPEYPQNPPAGPYPSVPGRPDDRILPPIGADKGLVARPHPPSESPYSPMRKINCESTRVPPKYQSHTPKRPRVAYDQGRESSVPAKWSESTAGREAQTPYHGLPESRDNEIFKAPAPIYPSIPAPYQSESRAQQAYDLTASLDRRGSNTSVESRQQPICEKCGNLQNIAEEIVSGLTLLSQDLHAAVVPASARTVSQPPVVSHVGVKEALEWVIAAVRANVGIVRNIGSLSSSSTANGPQMSYPYPDTPSSQGALEIMRRKIEILEREKEDTTRRASSISMEAPLTPDASSSSSAIGPRSSKITIGEPSPVRAATSSSFTHAHLNAGQHRQHHAAATSGSSAPPGIVSSAANLQMSAQSSHNQDLQHQVSTKTLALQTLQQEHDHLLSAYSRSQARCAALEKKFQVSDNEINNLTEERMKLSISVETLESQVESLIRSRDDARKQSVANGGQYMQIIAMASKLEAQGAADKKKRKQEADAWEAEKQQYEARIAELERDRQMVIKMAVNEMVPDSERGRSTSSEGGVRRASALIPSTTTPPAPSVSPCLVTSPTSAPRLTTHSSTSEEEKGVKPEASSSEVKDDFLDNATIDELKEEIKVLRTSFMEIEMAVQDIKSEGARVDQVMQKFGNIGKRIASKAERIRGVALNGKGMI